MIAIVCIAYGLVAMGCCAGASARVPLPAKYVGAIIWPALLCYKIGLWIGSEG